MGPEYRPFLQGFQQMLIALPLSLLVDLHKLSVLLISKLSCKISIIAEIIDSINNLSSVAFVNLALVRD